MATTSADRILSLDVIRGVAVMGIFSVNVIAFAMIEAAYFNPAAYGGHSGADLAVWAANMVVIDGKMRTLFSMLFGASMLLVIERAEAAGRSGWSTHFRRMAVLFGFGLLHYYFIWYGDILTLYAVSGLVAYRFRNMDSTSLVALGAAFVLGQMVMMGFALSQQHQVDVAAHAPLHVARRQHAVERRRERAHDLVADRLDDAAAVLDGERGEELHAQVDRGVRGRVAHGLVELGAAAHVGEHDAAGGLPKHGNSRGTRRGAAGRVY